MKVRFYDSLPEEAKTVRRKVFMEEQGFVNEFDETDEEAFHLVAFDDCENPIATCRFFRGTEENEYILGRLSVIKAWRGKNIGTKLLLEAEKYVKERNGHSILLHAQCRVTHFYNQIGYSEYGNIEDDEGCPHIWMRKELIP